MRDSNGKLDIKSLGAVLTLIIVLGGILMWKVDAAIADRLDELSCKIENKYVPRELYNLQISVINDKLDKILRAVK